MIDVVKYISIKEIISRVLRHPLLKNVNLEQGIQYAIDFIQLLGIPDVYEEKKACIDICNFRGRLPCDLVSIEQARIKRHKTVLIAMTDTFSGSDSAPAYKLQGDMMYTSFRDGEVEIVYKAIKTDDDGLPMIPDNSNFLRALELYIKLQAFTILFDLGKIPNTVLQNTQQDYAFAVGNATNEFLTPSVAEMESISNMMNRMLPDRKAYATGFKNVGKKEIRHY